MENSMKIYIFLNSSLSTDTKSNTYNIIVKITACSLETKGTVPDMQSMELMSFQGPKSAQTAEIIAMFAL